MVWLRWLDPKAGDQHVQMDSQQALQFIQERKDEGKVVFGVWEGSDEQLALETEMMNKTNLLQVLEERQGETLRLVPVVGGG